MRQLRCLAVALCSLLGGGVLAWQHPLWPTPMLLLFCLWCLAVSWRPHLWVFWVPALLPILNFAPWTGWLMVDEFDILLLATLAGAYFNRIDQHRTGAGGVGFEPHARWLVVIGLMGALGLYRGLADAGGFQFDGFADYAQPSNSWRVFKSLGFALLVAPLLRRELECDQKLTCQRLAKGMVLGLTLVALAALWERMAFPGMFDFSSHYRTVALFWEMHVGGAAIDAYLALATPFAFWALMQARNPGVWLAAACLTLLVVYADLTTFARGVYLAVGLPLLLLGTLLWVQKHGAATQAFFNHMRSSQWFSGWRSKGAIVLTAALLSEVVMVLGGGDFMAERLADTGHDLGSRMQHWRNGVGLLEQPSQLVLGLGLGRLPAHYAAKVAGREFSGSVGWQTEPAPTAPGNAFMRLGGPKSRAELAGTYELTQRVKQVLPGTYRVRLDARVNQTTLIELYLCERHLLYDRACKSALLKLRPGGIDGKPAWQPQLIKLEGPRLSAGAWFAPRLLVFSMSVVQAGVTADFDNIQLIGPDGSPALINGDFSRGLAHWFPAARSYYLPWHLDNLYLEVLVERGAFGLLLFLLPLTYAGWRLIFGRARKEPFSVYVAASLTGVLLVGLVSSVMDVPRVAFLFFLMTLMGVQITPPNASKMLEAS